MKNITKFLLFSIFCLAMINITLTDDVTNFNASNISILKLKVALAGDVESGTTCSRIKEFEACPPGSNSLFSITECEEYELVPPLVCDHCVKTDCN